ncbi:hypothetical protein M0805_006771 [Coniferiporia weirii]|nr:hypothetical protein M0805_006771 [Coniferiporia weirii]
MHVLSQGVRYFRRPHSTQEDLCKSLSEDVGQTFAPMDVDQPPPPDNIVDVLPILDIPLLTVTGRPAQMYRLPTHFNDYVSSQVPSRGTVCASTPVVEESAAVESLVDDIAPQYRLHQSDINEYGLFHIKRYHLPPAASAHNPSETDTGWTPLQANVDLASLYAPHPNLSAFKLNYWYQIGHPQKTNNGLADLQKLLMSDGFSVDNIKGVNFKRINKLLGTMSLTNNGAADNGWRMAQLKIPVPLGHISPLALASTDFDAGEFYYRPLVGVIRSVFSSKAASAGMVYEPYEMRYKPPSGGNEQGVYSKLFWSKEFRQVHEEVQALPREEGDNLPWSVMALQLWSDGMAATSFGTVKIWPVYLQFGNQSKYECTKTGAGCSHHLAHIPLLSTGNLQEFVKDHTDGCKASNELLTHCRREIMHAVWKIMLNDDFLDAWKNGIVVECGDGVKQRLFPHIFTYSADYPEKVLLAAMKYQGKHPCPWCLVLNKHIARLGMVTDTRRYKLGQAHIMQLLDEHSLMIVENMFSSRLSLLGFDFHFMLIVDLMHEWEVGIWWQIFTHLVRILASYKFPHRKVEDLNKRVTLIPSFGSAIWTYKGNISEMKQMTAHDFEDLLQCAWAAFEGLLPKPYNKVVMVLSGKELSVLNAQ